MPTTSIYALRYPAPADPADGPVGFQNLAEDVENKLGGLPVTSLPGSPVDGQIVRYRVTANGPVWVFQYVAASSAPKWHFLGGAALVARYEPEEAVGTIHPSWVATNPTVTLPLAGIYEVVCVAVFRTTVNVYVGIATAIGTGTVANASAFNQSLPQVAPGSMEMVTSAGTLTAASGGVVAASAFTGSAAGGFTAARSIQVTPQRVG